jgi:hypothetical protein
MRRITLRLTLGREPRRTNHKAQTTSTKPATAAGINTSEFIAPPF